MLSSLSLSLVFQQRYASIITPKCTPLLPDTLARHAPRLSSSWTLANRRSVECRSGF
jgi:hypothetical protein